MAHRNYRGIVSAIFFCLLSPFVQAAQDLPQAIRIAVPDSSTGSNRYSGGMVDVLIDQKLFEQEFAKDSIRIEWTFVKGQGPAINEALANHQVDFAYYGDMPSIVGRANGLDTRLISASRRASKAYLGVALGSNIQSLEDLKGKHLAVFRGTTYHLSLIRALESHGLTERDIKITSMDTAASSAALVGGLVDAVWAGNNLLELDNRGLAKVVLSTADLNNTGSTFEVLVGSEPFLERYPDLVVRLLAAHKKAYQWLSEEKNKPAYLEKAAKWSGYPPLLLQRDLGDEDFSEHFSPLLDAAYLNTLQADVEIAYGLRLIRKEFKVADWVQPSFQERALRQDQVAQQQ